MVALGGGTFNLRTKRFASELEKRRQSLGDEFRRQYRKQRTLFNYEIIHRLSRKRHNAEYHLDDASPTSQFDEKYKQKQPPSLD